MKVALSPIEFARRARRLYSKNEAVVDGDLRYTYEEFLNRCDQWESIECDISTLLLSPFSAN